MMSIGDSLLSNAGGRNPGSNQTSPFLNWAAYARLPKAHNALKTGAHSQLYWDFKLYLLFLPPCAVLGPRRFLSAEMARHQLFADALDNAIWAEEQTCLMNRDMKSWTTVRRGN
jgi:hypothetical protein